MFNFKGDDQDALEERTWQNEKAVIVSTSRKAVDFNRTDNIANVKSFEIAILDEVIPNCITRSSLDLKIKLK